MVGILFDAKGRVCSMDDDELVLVLFIVDDDKVSSLLFVRRLCCSLRERSIILISVETVNGRVLLVTDDMPV